MGARDRARLGRRMLAAAAGLLVLGARVGPASAAPSLVLAPTSGGPGAIVQATVYGIVSGDLTIWWDEDQVLLGSDASGRVRRVTFAVPSNAQPGQHVVRACNGSKCPPQASYADATFTVLGPTPAPTLKPTPRATPRPPPKPTPKPTPVPTLPTPVASPTAPGHAPTSTSTAAPNPSGTQAGGGGLGTPEPSAAGGLVIAATAEPAGSGDPFGQVKVQLPWLGLGALLLILAAIAGRALLRFRVRPVDPVLAAGKEPRSTLLGLVPGGKKPIPAPAPEDPRPAARNLGDASGQELPPELPVMASLVESGVGAGAAAPTETLTIAHEGFLGDAPGAAAGSADGWGKPADLMDVHVSTDSPRADGGGTDNLGTAPPPDEGPLKGSKIKEN